jgi:hypothetical protein
MKAETMNKDALVEITVKRVNGEIEYKVDCSREVKSEELAHYLDEIIEGICTWKPEVCEETVQTIVGKIKEQKEKISQTTLKAEHK